MAYPMTIPILAHGFVLVANIVLLGSTGDINAAGLPSEATRKLLHNRRHVNEVNEVDRFGSVSLQQLSHPAYYVKVKDSPVESDLFLNNDHNSGTIQQTYSPEGVVLHSDAPGKVAVSGMYSLGKKQEVPRHAPWESGVSNDDGLVTTDHNRLLGEGNYYHDMNSNDRGNVPVEQKVMYTYGKTVKIQKSTINYGTVNRMQQLETASPERNPAQYLIFGENYHHRTKDALDDKANRANIYNVSPNANRPDGKNTGNSFKLDDRIADQSLFYPVAKRNEAMSPSYIYRMSPSDEENSENSVGYAQRDSKLTLTSDIDDNAHEQLSSTPERPPKNQEGLRSDWGEFAPKSRSNHLIIKGIRGPDLTVKANTNWSGQKSISADLVARGAYVDVSRRIEQSVIGQSVMDKSEGTDLTANLNNADTDIFTDSNGHRKVDLIDSAVNSLPDISNEENSDEDSPRVVDPNYRLHNADKFTHQSDPTVWTLIHGIGPNDSVDRFSDVSSSAQLMPKAALPRNYNDYYWTSPVVNSLRNKGNGIHIQQQSKPRSNKEVFRLNGYIILQQLYQQQSSEWSVGKHKSQKNVHESNGLKQKVKSNLSQNIHRKSSNLNQNSNIELQMVETSEGHTHFIRSSNTGYRKVDTEERDIGGNFSYEDSNNHHIQQDSSVPKQEQSNNIDRDRKNKVSLERPMHQKNELFAVYLARDRHVGPRITQTKSDKPNETSSGRSSHTVTAQLHSSTSNKTNVGPFSLNKNQATQESAMLKEKRENPYAARLNENGISGIEQSHILEILYRRPQRPHMNLNDNMAIPQQSDAGQEKSNMVKVAYWDRTVIEPPLMDIDLANGQPSTSYPSSPQSDSTPESTSQIDLNVQFADGVILGNTPRKAFSQSISIDPLNSQMSLKYYSKSDWPHTAYDHVQQSKGFTQGIFSKQRSTAPIKDFEEESFQNQGKTSQTDHLPARLKRDINNGGFLSSMTRSSDSHGDRKKRRADTVRNNLFHWSTMSRPNPSPVYSKSYGSKHEQNVNIVSSNNRIVQNSNHFTSLVPDDENSKSNPDQSIIRHLQHKLLKHHPRGHRRVRIGSRYSYTDLHTDTLRGGDVYRNNQVRNNRVPLSSRRK